MSTEKEKNIKLKERYLRKIPFDGWFMYALGSRAQ